NAAPGRTRLDVGVDGPGGPDGVRPPPHEEPGARRRRDGGIPESKVDRVVRGPEEGGRRKSPAGGEPGRGEGRRPVDQQQS
ncbi:hypothetical protein THAOC_17358, partial [Thalassiosira oceanica]